MLFCILIHMDAKIILYSTYVFENFCFCQIPEVNPSLKIRFPDEKMIMKISIRIENFAQNWLTDVICCSKKFPDSFVLRSVLKVNFLPVTIFDQKITSGNHFWAKFYVRKWILIIIFSSGNLIFREGLTSGICQKWKFSKT